ncbi:MAG TPA: MFS transporter [Nevskiaceae bacterium]|nr:MFS transporter [Nevskiaceae bacterium]
MTATTADVDRGARHRLILCRGLRSIGQGLLVVDFPLYLDALGWNGVQIGALFTAIVVLQAALTLFSGPLSDRYGRRGFLLGYDATLIGSALLAFFTPIGWALSLAALAGGFGRGMNGAAGPFSPVEQAWLAHATPAHKRGGTFSVNTAVGASGMAIGALLATLPAVWSGPFPGPLAYRPMFLLVAVVGVATLVAILSLHETPREPPASHAAPRAEENRRMASIVWVQTINGAAVGLIAPLITYWFLLRYHVGPAHIGPVLAISFALSGGLALLTGRLIRGRRMVNLIVGLRAVAVLLLVFLPLAPTFFIAAAIYIARSALNRSTTGARQALNLSLVSDQRRGLAATVSSLSFQVPRSVGPIIAGSLFAAGSLGLPFFIGAALQATYLVVYRHVFGAYEKGLPELRERQR